MAFFLRMFKFGENYDIKSKSFNFRSFGFEQHFPFQQQRRLSCERILHLFR